MQTSRLCAFLDHVAVAVPSSQVARRRWQQALGAGFAGGTQRNGFITSQWRYRNGGKLELIEPDPGYPSEKVYLTGFLARYGARIHHVTLKIEDMEQSLATLRREGIEPIGINREPLFGEAFIRPADGGGLLIQLLETQVADHEWAHNHQLEAQPPPPGGADLLAIGLRHPDPAIAARLWGLLGAEVNRQAGQLWAKWRNSPVKVRIETGQPAGPVGLVFNNTAAMPAHPRIGPAIETGSEQAG